MSEQDKMTSQGTEKKSTSVKLYEWKSKVDKHAYYFLQLLSCVPNQSVRIHYLMNGIFDVKNNVSGVVPNNKMFLHTKDENESEKHRVAADKCVENKLSATALEEYTKAIAYGRPNTLMLSISYNARSSILYDLGMFESCLKDLKRVSLIYLPHMYKHDFYERKAICHHSIFNKVSAKSQTNTPNELFEEHLRMTDAYKSGKIPVDRGNEVCYNPTIPILENKNALIPGLSDAVELNFTNDLGCHIIAARDIKPGELIGICKPYATALCFGERFKFCWHCTKQIWNGVPCERCVCAVYCSDYCREKSFAEYHDIECTVTSSLEINMADDISLMTLRLAIKAYKECGCKLEKLLSTYDIDGEPPRTQDEAYKRDYDITKFSSVYNLSKTFDPNLNMTNSELFADSLIIAYYMGVSIGLVKHNKSLIELKNCDKFTEFVAFIEKTMRIVYTNIIVHRSLGTDQPEQTGILKTTINPSTVLFKHQCFADITRVILGECEAIYTITPIKKGQQIFDNYGFNFFDENRLGRRAQISTHLGYECNCIACVNDWCLEDSKLSSGDVGLIDLEKIRSSIELLEKRIAVLHDIASMFLRNRSELIDVSETINELIDVVTTCHKYLKPYSVDFVKAKCTLSDTLRLLQVPLINLK